jgi:hypothetical protein
MAKTISKERLESLRQRGAKIHAAPKQAAPTPPPAPAPTIIQPDPNVARAAQAAAAAAQEASRLSKIMLDAFKKLQRDPVVDGGPKPIRFEINRDHQGLIESVDIVRETVN